MADIEKELRVGGMTDADRSTGSSFGFARGPASEQQQRPARLEAPKKVETPKKLNPTVNPTVAAMPINAASRPISSGYSPDVKRRRRSPGKGKVMLERSSSSEDLPPIPPVSSGEKKVWLALSLAGLTYAVGLAGFLSTVRSIGILS